MRGRVVTVVPDGITWRAPAVLHRVFPPCLSCGAVGTTRQGQTLATRLEAQRDYSRRAISASSSAHHDVAPLLFFLSFAVPSSFSPPSSSIHRMLTFAAGPSRIDGLPLRRFRRPRRRRAQLADTLRRRDADHPERDVHDRRRGRARVHGAGADYAGMDPHAPPQSCFMISVDLHTHASFQCMLPEFFVVVCAPKSDPSIDIFRLTDPPGLQTVLKCMSKQVFHPHPDVLIYTMRDVVLEIVDLR
ncbi:hypothetical protein K438DRAFT_2024008 [Mycena galopus ATCC 62051]|nr:hypothetical protein K438DRAFT_2024008 [Mycena galopus ATCC 62051]